jgi:hypothetical protein
MAELQGATLHVTDDDRYVSVEAAEAAIVTPAPDAPTYQVVSAVMTRLLQHPEELTRP